MNCEECKVEFIANRKWQRFCSATCRNKSEQSKFINKKVNNALIRVSSQIEQLINENEKLKQQNDSFKETIKRQSDRIMDLINELEIAKEEISKLRDNPPPLRSNKAYSTAFASTFDRYIKDEFRYYEPHEVEIIRTFASKFTHYINQL
jgi:chromosome segregation ATPase